MPVYDRTLTERLDSDSPTPAFVARAESSSEAAALPNGEKALTPILAGSISGTVIVIAWTVAAVYALIKYHRRKKRFKRAGRPDLMHEAPKPEPFILPPDPAIVQGQLKPGDHVFKDCEEAEGKKKGKGKSKEGRLDSVGEGDESGLNLDLPQRPPKKRQSTPIIWKSSRSRQDHIDQTGDKSDHAGEKTDSMKEADFAYHSRPAMTSPDKPPDSRPDT